MYAKRQRSNFMPDGKQMQARLKIVKYINLKRNIYPLTLKKCPHVFQKLTQAC